LNRTVSGAGFASFFSDLGHEAVTARPVRQEEAYRGNKSVFYGKIAFIGEIYLHCINQDMSSEGLVVGWADLLTKIESEIKKQCRD
jgi:hypothetical protein